jgi:hypothetical protein
LRGDTLAGILNWKPVQNTTLSGYAMKWLDLPEGRNRFHAVERHSSREQSARPIRPRVDGATFGIPPGWPKN